MLGTGWIYHSQVDVKMFSSVCVRDPHFGYVGHSLGGNKAQAPDLLGGQKLKPQCQLLK